MSLTKTERRNRIKYRIRKTIKGTTQKPRMSVYRSNKQIYVQLVDDLIGKTLVSGSSLYKELVESKSGDKKNQAKQVGKLIAEKCLKLGISEVVFDRNGYLYHGRVKQLADAAREGGLKF
jgi:large subunit ribosomal protein L18